MALYSILITLINWIIPIFIGYAIGFLMGKYQKEIQALVASMRKK